MSPLNPTKPAPTVSEQAFSAARRPPVLVWAAFSAACLVALVGTAPDVGFLTISAFFLGCIGTYASTRVR